MPLDRRSFLQGVAAVLSAAAVTPAVASQPSMAEIVGKASERAFPIGSILMVSGSMNRAPHGFVFLDGQTLKASEFPELSACVGCGADGAITLHDMHDGRLGTLRWVMRIA